MKATKPLLKEFKEVADQLPQFNYTTNEKYPIPGPELKLTGVTEVEGQPIDDNKIYDIETPSYHKFNHYRRMKRMYQRSASHKVGYKLVKDYITAVVTAAQKQEHEN